VTATLIDALDALERIGKLTALRQLRGKIAFKLELEQTRR
jgi:hypothetical protein